MKKIFASVGLCGALMAGLASPAGAVEGPSVDSAVSITSAAPVPGGFTVGSWKITNTDSLFDVPAGTTYRVVFQETKPVAGLGNGSTTVTSISGANVFKIAPNVYQISLNQAIKPGQSVTGLWSMAQPIYTARANVSISLNTLPVQREDYNSANDFASYTNGSEGF